MGDRGSQVVGRVLKAFGKDFKYAGNSTSMDVAVSRVREVIECEGGNVSNLVVLPGEADVGEGETKGGPNNVSKVVKEWDGTKQRGEVEAVGGHGGKGGSKELREGVFGMQQQYGQWYSTDAVTRMTTS